MGWMWLVRAAHAQAPREHVAVLFSGWSFFVAVIAGLILALGFQLVLTNLSVAAGVTAIGPFDKPGPAGVPAKSWGVTARKVTGVLGIWALLTASVSLFFASWLAVELSLTWSILGGAVLGLVIWGLFYLILMAFEATAMWSLAGSLVRAMTNTLSGGYRAVSSMFTATPEDRMADAAAKITKAVTDELREDLALDDLRGDLRKYVRQLSAPAFDAAAIRREVVSMLQDVELRTEIEQAGDAFNPREIVITRLTSRGFGMDDAKAVAQGVSDALTAIREERRSGKDTTSAAVDASLRIAGWSPREARATREKVEAWLRQTGSEALSPEGIKADLEKLFASPSEGAQALKQRVAGLDRDTIANIVAARADLSPDQARQVIDAVDGFFRGLAQKVSGIEVQTPNAPNVEARLKAYVDGLNRPELDYDGLKHDLMRLMEDPKAGADALLARAKSLDRDTLKAILASRRDWNEQDAERVLSRMEEVRDTVLHRAEKVRDDVQHRLEDARQEALHQADEARQTAATAAWWGFGTAVVSGAAAVLGGIVAAST